MSSSFACCFFFILFWKWCWLLHRARNKKNGRFRQLSSHFGVTWSIITLDMPPKFFNKRGIYIVEKWPINARLNDVRTFNCCKHFSFQSFFFFWYVYLVSLLLRSNARRLKSQCIIFFSRGLFLPSRFSIIYWELCSLFHFLRLFAQIYEYIMFH